MIYGFDAVYPETCGEGSRFFYPEFAFRSDKDSANRARLTANDVFCAAQTGIEVLPSLRVLYLSNNKLRDWTEVERLAGLPALQELLLAGNPLQSDYANRGAVAEYRIEVCGLVRA